MTTSSGRWRRRPSTSGVPLTHKPSERTKTARSPGPASSAARRAPASNESAAVEIAVKARRRSLCSKRAMATLTLASRTVVPAISPEVEQPAINEFGNAAASCANGVGSVPNSAAANASTRVRALSRSAGSGAAHPSPAVYRVVSNRIVLSRRTKRCGDIGRSHADLRPRLDRWRSGRKRAATSVKACQRRLPEVPLRADVSRLVAALARARLARCGRGGARLGAGTLAGARLAGAGLGRARLRRIRDLATTVRRRRACALQHRLHRGPQPRSP